MRTFYDMLPYQMEEELGREPKDSSFWCDYYGEVGSQIKRMTSMLTNLSEGARASVLKVEDEIDLLEAFKKASELTLGKDLGIEVDFQVNGVIPSIAGDAQNISQMARLLFQESKSAVGSEGSIEVRLSSGSSGNVQIVIVDSGDAIAEEDLKHLFDPFFVRNERPEDLGTNLMACYLTVYHHGGTIKARRTRDGRNAIEISLPVKPLSEEQAQRSRRVLDQFSEFEVTSGNMGLPA
jgi:K+-sensing histidine kinase KdpD